MCIPTLGASERFQSIGSSNAALPRVADRPVASLAKSSPAVEHRERVATELCSRSSIALEKMSERLKHLQFQVASLTVRGGTQAKGALDSRDLSLVTPRGSVVDLKRRSTFYDEDLVEVMDLSGIGTWAHRDLHEIIPDLVEARSLLQSISKGHVERMTALEHNAQDRGPGLNCDGSRDDTGGPMHLQTASYTRARRGSRCGF